jgi:hypothetical protein
MQRREVEYPIKTPEQMHLAIAWMQRMVMTGLQNGKPVFVRIGRERRNLEMNAKLWAMLGDVSRQVKWYNQSLSPEDWKHIFSAACLNQRTVPGIDGGIVVLGQSTSKMTKRQFSDLIELIYSFGAEHNVTWSDPTMSEMYPEYVNEKM